MYTAEKRFLMKWEGFVTIMRQMQMLPFKQIKTTDYGN